MIPQRELAPGVAVSAIGFGGYHLGLVRDETEAIRILHAAIDAGITFLDNAWEYNEHVSEERMGEGLAEGSLRDRVFLMTKVCTHGRGADVAMRQLEESLRRLRTDHIDLYQLHYPDPKTPIAETLGALGELVAEGKVREIGCSNFDAAMLEEAADAVKDGAPGFVSVQNEYSLLHRDAEDEVLGFCDRTHTAFLPYFPLASGLLSGKYRAGAGAPEGTRLAAWGSYAKDQLSDERLATVAALDALAQTEGHTVLDLAFAWLLAARVVSSVIAGATKADQVKANAAAASWHLSDDERAEVNALLN